jgi:putative ABC transport system permease protein
MDRLRQFFVETRGRQIAMTAVDMNLPAELGRFAMIDGDPDEALQAVAKRGEALISEPLALKEDLGKGDLLQVHGSGGAVEFRIAGVFYDYSSERGGAVIDLSTMDRLFGPGPVSNLALYLEPGIDAEQLTGVLRARFEGTPLSIRSNRDLRTEVFRIFDQTFAVTRLLQAMSLLIAVCGITLTLIVLARERVAELALYRALGASRRRIFRVFVGKGLGIAGFGLLLGIPGGAALALTLILLVNRAWFGWTIAIHWPLAAVARGASMILVASVLASLYPAYRASRTPATELSRENL